jgi:hypothetical protein
MRYPLALLTLGGCAGIPHNAAAKSQFSQLNCSQLARESAQIEETKRVAAQTRADSWKFVVPVAVVARYANASADIVVADKRAATLVERQKEKGCTNTGS